MRKTTIGKRILVMLLAFVMLLSGIIPSGFSIQTVKAADTSSVWFEYTDGSKQYLDDTNTITLKTTDKGYFKSDRNANWQCKYQSQAGSQVLINKTSGEFCYSDIVPVPYTFSRAQAYDIDDPTWPTFQYFNLKIEAGEVALDTTALQTAINSASSMEKGNYTDDSWNAMQKALASARSVLEAANAKNTTQDAIDSAVTALNNAVQGLKQGTTASDEMYVYFEYEDGTTVGHITANQTLTLKTTDKGTFRLNGNVGTGDPHWNGCINMDTGAFISMGKVKTSTCTVNTADWSKRFSFTVKIVADTDALQAAITRAEAITNDGYTSASWSNFGIALVNAKTMLEDSATDGTDQSNINQATGNLLSAINALKKEGEIDKDALDAAITTAESKQQSAYTSATWTALQEALTAAKAVQEKTDATQDEVDAAATALQSAINALVARGNKTALNTAIQTAESKNKDDYTADTWSAVDAALKTAKEVAENEDATQTEVDSAAKALNDAVNALKSTASKVYFETSDGTKVYAKDGVFTLKSTDKGTFKMEGRTDVNWNCDSKVPVINPNTGEAAGTRTHYWIKWGNGQFDGSAGAVSNVKGTVVDSANKVLESFVLNVIVEKYAELKAYVGDKEVTVDAPHHVSGTDAVSVTIKARKEGEETFETIDPSLLTVAEANTNEGRYNRVNKTYQVLTEETKAVFTVSLTADSNVKTQFALYSDKVAMTDFSIKMPSVWYIDAWNGLAGNEYAGITQGNGDDNYSISYTPYNTSNQSLKWENLTPDIAEYSDEAFSAGIVPKKAGVARFKVSSVQNPEISKEVSVEFRYKTPLTAANAVQTLTIEKDATQALEIGVVPTNATEQRFNWTYSVDGMVQVTDSVYQDPNSVLTPKSVSHSIKALKAGEVTVTGTPIDQTGSCEPITIHVRVTENGQLPEKVDVDSIVSKGIASASSWLNAQGYKYECNGTSDWYIMSKLRTGQNISDANKEAYYESAAATVAAWKADQSATDIERVALTLSAMGKDITDVNGVNLAAMIYNHASLGDFSNNLFWGLIALDATAQEIPADAKWSRDAIIDKLLTFQNQETGGFGWSGTSWTDTDSTAMAVQALAPYSKQAKVKAAIDKAFTYIKNDMDSDYGFSSSETAAQVLLALASLKMDPVANGFGTEYAHIVSTLDKYYAVAAGGFAHVKDGAVNAMATYQTMEGLEAYRRFKASESSYWDMTDVKPSKPENPENPNAFDLTCSAEGVTGVVGDTVTVKVNVSSDTKLGGVEGKVGYDKEILKLTDIKYTGFGEGLSEKSNIGFVANDSFTSGTIELKFEILKCTDKAVDVNITKLLATDDQGDYTSKEYNLTAQVRVNHKVEIVPGKAATCTVDGLSDGQKCAACGTVLKKQEVIKAKGHTPVAVPAKAATCTTTGLTEGKICSTCKTVLQKQNVTPALGHSFGAWTTTVASTVMAEGQQTRTCTRCGHSETQALAKLQPNAALAIHNFPLKVKQSYTVKVNNIAAGDSVVSWKSSNTKIVTVNNAGKVTGKKKGTATITATLASGQVLSTTVKVQTGTVKTTGITVNSRNVTLKAKAGFQIQATRNPETSQQAISYSTSNKKVATVTKKGYIKGVKAGKATITVKSGSKKVKINVIVEGVKTTGLTANKTEITLKKKKSFAWKVKKVPTNSSEDITYSTSNKKVATVNKNGKISAKKAGTATITAKSGNQKITIKVTVK